MKSEKVIYIYYMRTCSVACTHDSMHHNGHNDDLAAGGPADATVQVTLDLGQTLRGPLLSCLTIWSSH